MTNFEHIDGVVEIAGSLHVKKPQALRALLEEPRTIGYKVEDLRQCEHRKRDGASVKMMEHEDWSMWFAKLDVRRGKCGTCNGLISTVGILQHGHKCELCGAVTYENIIDGTMVRFSFINKGEAMSFTDMKMKAKRWDIEDGWLYFYPGVYAGFWTNETSAKAYFDANAYKWEYVNEGGEDLVRIRESLKWNRETATINVSDTSLHRSNHKIVNVWEGVEYDKYDRNFPLPESMSIHEAWHWAPLQATPKLHEKIIHAAGMVSRCDYYYQDGRAAFYPVHFERMRKFVEHFTALEVSQWDIMIFRADKSGPGMIRAIAAFCHPKAEVVNEPNIGNVLVGYSKALQGQVVSDSEKGAMVDALRDRRVKEDFVGILKNTRS